MCVQGVSGHLFPCSTKPTSIATTIFLVVAVATGILAGLAYHFQWGMPIMCSLASISGISVILAFAIACCRKHCTRMHIQRRILEEWRPIPSEVMPNVFEGTTIPESEHSSETIPRQLYELVKRGDIESFRQAVSLYDTKAFSSMSMHLHTIMLPSISHGHSLFQLILDIEEEEVKPQFLQIALEKIDEVDETSESMISKFLDIKDEATIEQLFIKMSERTRTEVLKAAVDPGKPQRPIWYEVAVVNWQDRSHFVITMMITAICKSTLSPEDKIQHIIWIGNKRLDEIEIDGVFREEHSSYRSCRTLNVLHITLSVLHIAINVGAIDFVKHLIKDKKLLNKPSKEGLTPLLLTLWSGDLDILNVLLKAGENPNHAIKKEETVYRSFRMREGATQQTPLMIAALLRNEALYQALIENGADPSVPDNPIDIDAWSAADYHQHYLEAK